MADRRIPIVVICTGLGTGAAGLALGARGGLQIKRSHDQIQRDEARYDGECRLLKERERATNEALGLLGERQEEALLQVVERMADFLRRHEKQVSESEKLLADGVESSPGEVAAAAGLKLDPRSALGGLLGSVASGVAVNRGLIRVAHTYGRASTGRPISMLNGAAKTNATQALFGGGSIASGGGGKKRGNVAMKCATVGPPILLSGLVTAREGREAMRSASDNERAVDAEIAKMRLRSVLFDAAAARAEEVASILDQLVLAGTSALDLLESEPFEPDRHATRLHQALELAYAVRDVARAQVVTDQSGDLNADTAAFTVKYRTLIKEHDDE